MIAGAPPSPPIDWRSNLHVFAPPDSGVVRLIADSTNGSGSFNYEYHPGFDTYEEPEGIDWLDSDAGTPSALG